MGLKECSVCQKLLTSDCLPSRITVEPIVDENGETINATLHISCAQVSDVGNYTCFAMVPAEGEVPISSKTVVLDVGGW